MNDTVIFAIFGVLAAGLAIYFAAQGPKKRTNPAIPTPVPKPTPTLNWPDRRPIGMVMVAEWTEPHLPGNRKWKMGSKHGEASRELLLSFADRCVRYLTEQNAQGIITWNIEGEEYWKPVSYIGDPRMVPPEIEPYIDEYFAKFKGFRTGVCIRPTVLTGIKHIVPANPFNNLCEKIDYARARWGCTLFYVDSNKDAPAGMDNTDGHGNPLPFEVFRQLAEKYPDCLIIPEHHTPDYYPHAAVWTRGPVILNNALVVGAVNLTDEVDAFVAAGNIPLFECWWGNPIHAKIKKAYQNK